MMNKNEWMEPVQGVMAQVVAGHTVGQLLLVATLLLLAFLLKRRGARIVNQLVFRAFDSTSVQGDEQRRNRDEFVQMLSLPMQAFSMALVFYLCFTLLNIPQTVRVFEKDLRVHHFADMFMQLLLIVRLIRLLLGLTTFLGVYWTRRAEGGFIRLDKQMIPFTVDGIKILLVIFGILLAAGGVFDADVTALIGGLGIGGLAVALAAQESLANLLGSFTIFLDKPFQVGDSVEFSGVSGTIEKVGFRSTRIRTLDKTLLTVPNKNLVGAPLNNMSEGTQKRARFQLTLNATTPADALKAIVVEIRTALTEHPQIEHGAQVHFFDYTEKGYVVQVNYLVNTGSHEVYCGVREEVNFRIYDIIRQNGSTLAMDSRSNA
ncbi:MAG: mechanosensitive ion channel family protein [Sphingomonadales bacterium]|nr:mechanosensitive ion channel family protein [Sphingomonadales bacterium]